LDNGRAALCGCRTHSRSVDIRYVVTTLERDAERLTRVSTRIRSRVVSFGDGVAAGAPPSRPRPRCAPQFNQPTAVLNTRSGLAKWVIVSTWLHPVWRSCTHLELGRLVELLIWTLGNSNLTAILIHVSSSIIDALCRHATDNRSHIGTTAPLRVSRGTERHEQARSWDGNEKHLHFDLRKFRCACAIDHRTDPQLIQVQVGGTLAA
jgi:hypothetical protein